MWTRLCYFLFLGSAVAFQSRAFLPKQKTMVDSSCLKMFSTDDEPRMTVQPLPTMEEDEPVVAAVVESTNVVKDMNTGEIKEVKWTDPAMEAHTKPWMMSWWAYPVFGYPFLLLLNDVFHFWGNNNADNVVAP